MAGTGVSSTLIAPRGARFRGDTISFIFQDFNLLPVSDASMKTSSILSYMVQKVAAPGEEEATGKPPLSRAVGMATREDKYPDQISGGQKQRVAIARALVQPQAGAGR